MSGLDFLSVSMTSQYSRRRFRRRLQRPLLIAALCVIAGAALVSQDGTASKTTSRTTTTVPSDAILADRSQSATTAGQAALQAAASDSIQMPQPSPWTTVEVSRGQTFSTLLEGQGMPRTDWVAVLALGGDTDRLKRLQVGDKLHFRMSDDNRLEELSYEFDELRTLQIRRIEGQLEAITLTADLERRPARAHAEITSSLFASGVDAGLSNRLIMEMAEIFSYDIDFALDLRQGDRFALVYEELYKNGEKLRDGNILAAEFVNQRRHLQALRHEDSEGRGAYYNAKGESLRTAFKRTPLDFARISSPFNLNRRHPILNTIRAHRGTDYAARSGTPIRATGDGKIVFQGVKSGYGRVVIVKHGSAYETLYAHMSRFRSGLGPGKHVSQGQVIGYVGQSGLATAPHLHYEFRVNGVHKNPVTVPLPRANPLSRAQMASWQPLAQSWLAQLDEMAQQQQLARNTVATE